MKMKIILLILCCITLLRQCFGHDHHGEGHGDHHGHHHGHDHGQHGHDHGNYHEEYENLNDYRDDVKFRYSKKANVDEKSPDGDGLPDKKIVAAGEEIHYAKEHDHQEINQEVHGHDVKEENEQSDSFKGHTHNHGHSHDHGDVKTDEHSHSHGHSNDHDDTETDGHTHSHSHSHEREDMEADRHAHTHGHSHMEKASEKKGYKKEAVYWLEPLLATAMISAAPFLILFVVPLTSNSPESRPFLKVLLSFASGGLLGDAFLHLIPHAISPHSHSEDHSTSHGHTHGDKGHDHTSDMIVGLWVLGGIIAFLMVEKFVRFVKGGHGHSHSHVEPKMVSTSEGDGCKKGGDENDGTEEDEIKDDETKPIEEVAVVESEEREIKVAAYLNLAADCTHNFTDGLAIGASFLISRNVGLITTLTIFLHEIPHEIGDFAILIQSGCTKRKAMLLQLVTAVGAFAGCICGLLAEGLGTAASAWILPFTAGGFIYIATVSVIPELLEESKLIQSIKEILALLVGVFLMVLIALTE